MLDYQPLVSVGQRAFRDCINELGSDDDCKFMAKMPCSKCFLSFLSTLVQKNFSHIEENIATNSCIFNKPIQINIVPTFWEFHSTNFDGVPILPFNQQQKLPS